LKPRLVGLAVETSEFKFAVETKFVRLAVRPTSCKLAVETRFTRFANDEIHPS
jgi:hypothetical protein